MPRPTTYHDIHCPCGEVFVVTAGIKDRAKYCSQACKYKYRMRPKGLKYVLHKENPTSFKPGHIGPTGEDHPGWKGEDVGYKELHRWVSKNKTKTGECPCGFVGYTEWSNVSFEYHRDLNDWQELCKKCHSAYDKAGRGAATEIFGAQGVQNGYGGRL